MPIEKIPTTKAPWPPTVDELGRTPKPYPLTNKGRESFYTIADALKKKGMQIEPIELVKFNFRTTDFGEVNWYLKNYVGCTQATTDKKNYSFAGLTYRESDRNRALIFVPRKVIELDEPIIIIGPPTPSEQGLLAGGFEFELSGPPHRFETSVIRGTITLSGKGKVAFLESGRELGGGLTKEEIGVAFTRKLSDDVSVQVGGKVKLEDLRKPGKDLIKNFRDSLEATVAATPFRSKGGDASVTFEAGAKISATPLLFKVGCTWEGKTDLAPYLPKSLNITSLPVVFSVTGQVTIEFGPSPSVLRMLGPAAIVAGAFIGFIAFGAWYGGRAAERGRLMGLASWYVGSYLFASGFGGVASFPTTPDERRLVDAGCEDAERDMMKTFPGRSSRDVRFLWMALWILAGGGKLGTPEGAQAGRRALEERLWRDVKAKMRF
ncbi:MAG: hypothetical protein ABWZ80_09770 [Beijerinckiaceae bacterium]